MKDVEITVYDKQIYEDHSDEAENNFKGSIAYKNDSVYITYKDEREGVTTIIKVKGKEVQVKRLGTVRAQLEFDTTKPYQTLYSTPYGEMLMEIVTNKVDIYFLERGIKVYIEYKIMMQNEKVSDNIYLIVAN